MGITTKNYSNLFMTKMRINILLTGSNGNCSVVTFSDNKQVVFDFGTGAKRECARNKDFFDISKVDNVLITHNHSDHNGDFKEIGKIIFPKTLKVLDFEVLHNVENKGYAVLNQETKEVCVYATDYYSIPDASFEKLLKIASFKDYKIMMCLELSYNKFLYDKMTSEERIGLDNHCSDILFFHYAKQILNTNPKVNIVTLHASGRTAECWEKGQNKVGKVCAEDYCKQKFYELFPKSNVRFGKASGFCGNYNFINK